MEQLLNLSVIASPLLYSVYALSALAALFLVLRAGLRPGPPIRVGPLAGDDDGSPPRASQLPRWRKWLVTAATAAAGGALTGAVVLFVSDVVLNVFGLPRLIFSCSFMIP